MTTSKRKPSAEKPATGGPGGSRPEPGEPADPERPQPQAEQELRESAERLSATLRSIADGVIACDMAGAVVSLNAAAEIMTGWTSTEAAGKPVGEVFRIVNAQSREAVANPVLLITREDAAGDLANDTTLIARDGTERQIAGSCAPIHDTSGKVSGAVLVFRDLTESKEAEEALRESERLFYDMFERSHAVKLLIDAADGAIVDANSAAADFYGYSVQQLRTMKIGDINTLPVAEIQAEMADAITERRACFDFCHRLADGAIRDVEVYSSPLHHGGRTLLNSIIHDVTERKRAEEALRESEEHYRFVAENVGDVLWVMDAGTQRFTYVSPSVMQLRGYTPEEVMAQPVSESLTPDSLQLVQELMTRRLLRFKTDPHLLQSTTDPQRPVAFVNEADQPCRDGSIVHTEVTTTWSRRPDGQLQIIGVSRDITERKRAVEALAELNDELEERVAARTAELKAANLELEAFVYSVSHDLRAPLRAIDGFSEMVVEDAAERLDVGDLEHLQRVRAAAQRMGLLIDHMLALSRAARKDLLREPVDLSAVAASVLNDLRASAPERRVETLVQPGLVVVCDATLLRLILENLLGNAWKYTAKHESARIEVGVVDADGERGFYVKDDGAGFDGAHAEHLFGAFQRMHTADQFEGDGIGLATVQRLVARHGGRVWAEAEVEKGATFSFTLPAPGHRD